MKFIDLIGQKFGRLTPIKYMSKDKWSHNLWLCRCDCEKEAVVIENNLKNGNTKSCGCLNKEMVMERSTTHGHSSGGKLSKTYISWENMKARCNNPKDRAYKDYGGRDIMVCERWKSFENFFEDVGEIPEGLTLDRIDNNKGYYPDNWKFSTMKEQTRNKRSNIMVPYNGDELCLTDYCKIKNLNYKTINMRINRGWSIEKALMTPLRQRENR